MKQLLVLLITLAILALQYHLGVRRHLLPGALLPAAFLTLFIAFSIWTGEQSLLWAGLPCVGALILVWIIGRVKSRAVERAELEQMKKKDL